MSKFRTLTLALLIVLVTTPIHAFAAIAFDATVTSVNPGSNTVSFTTSGSDRYLVVQVLSSPGDTVTGVTYNGVAMSQIMTSTFGAQANEFWGLANPASGTNDVVVSFSGSPSTVVVDVISYTGAQQTTPIEATGNNSGSGTSASVSVTTLTDNAWLVGYFRANSASGGFTAGANTVIRTDAAEGTRQLADSGADQTPAGSHSLNATMETGSWNVMAFSLKPAGGGAATGEYQANSQIYFVGL
jgi:hypothetical protein